MESAVDQSHNKMEPDGAKSDVKTLFFITNTFHALIASLLPLSMFLAMMISAAEKDVVFSAIIGGVAGLPLLGLNVLGYYGAMIGNRMLLRIYSTLTVLATLASMVAAAKLGTSQVVAVVEILNCLIMIPTVTLSLILAKQVAKDGRPQTLPPCSKCFYISIAVVTVLYLGYVYTFFV